MLTKWNDPEDTELTRARQHWMRMQSELYTKRKWVTTPLEWRLKQEYNMEYYVDRYLAALSWVWDAQERAGRPAWVDRSMYRDGPAQDEEVKHEPVGKSVRRKQAGRGSPCAARSGGVPRSTRKEYDRSSFA